MELHALTALQLGEKIQAGEVSPVEATQAVLDRVRREQSRNNAFITVLGDAALSEARETEKRLRAGARLSPLAGVPMGLKDNICTKGIKTSCASKILGDFAPPYDATLVQRLRAAGGVLLGKLNMDEFAMGSTSETSFYGPVRNPWDLTRVPGGSSGGAAAAVAAGECWYAVGSDTGGSIRQPAAYCGVTGMKPTYGTVSRYGLVAYASSLDQMGPIARSAADCAAVLDLIMGRDRRDGTSLEVESGGLLAGLTGDVRGTKIVSAAPSTSASRRNAEASISTEASLWRCCVTSARRMSTQWLATPAEARYSETTVVESSSPKATIVSYHNSASAARYCVSAATRSSSANNASTRSRRVGPCQRSSMIAA